MLVGFIGKKRAGKTTAARLLDGFKVMGFKDELVKEIKKNFPDLLEELAKVHDCSIDELFIFKPALARKLLQNYGTEVRRNDDEDYWVNKLADRIGDCSDNIAVDDVRFLNEAKLIRDLGGCLVLIKTDDVLDEEDTHVSETEMDWIVPDYIIENNSSIDDLKENVNAICKISKNT